MADPVSNQVINGSHGQVWADADLVMEALTFEANIEIEYADVNMAGNGATFKKAVGWTGSGTLNVNHVNRRQITKLAEAIKAGKTVRSTIMGKLADPDANGNERVILRDVTFNSLQLMKFEQKSIVTEDISFNFSDFETL